jgi:hypothetical protein
MRVLDTAGNAWNWVTENKYIVGTVVFVATLALFCYKWIDNTPPPVQIPPETPPSDGYKDYNQYLMWCIEQKENNLQDISKQNANLAQENGELKNTVEKFSQDMVTLNNRVDKANTLKRDMELQKDNAKKEANSLRRSGKVRQFLKADKGTQLQPLSNYKMLELSRNELRNEAIQLRKKTRRPPKVSNAET